MKWVIRKECLKVRINQKAVENIENTKFLQVILERLTLNPIKKKVIKNNPIKDQDLKKDNIMLGQMVSACKYILWDPDRL